MWRICASVFRPYSENITVYSIIRIMPSKNKNGSEEYITQCFDEGFTDYNLAKIKRDELNRICGSKA